MHRFTPAAAIAAALALGACTDIGTATRSNIDPVSLASAPPGAAPGTCWDKTVSPAVVETQTRRVQLQPAQISTDGRVQSPPIYKTEEQQIVIEPRRETWFEIPCADVMTPDFIASLQRALAARGHFKGQITGKQDLRTRQAIHSFQRSEGFDNPTLTVAAARKLGLIAVPIANDA
ncbi:peptidoglycan-binding domain-containing protein [Tateyamaria sp. SN6-1]|uniref:peptidoglycan-binding domain-containing protein n=1 Tax=Tateyamaria sp. SN6-1 TaxID=3092148 RepID=UPI0039F60B1E